MAPLLCCSALCGKLKQNIWKQNCGQVLSAGVSVETCACQPCWRAVISEAMPVAHQLLQDCSNSFLEVVGHPRGAQRGKMTKAVPVVLVDASQHTDRGAAWVAW